MPISTVVTSMKDEAPYIIEWVAYHRALGFDRVVVLANDCTDGTHEMLTRLRQMGAITYYENEVPIGAKPHSQALKIANNAPEVQSADFVMVLDADEFLVVKKPPHTLNVLLDMMQDKTADMMVIPWRMFGSSHLTEFDDRPVIERFTQSMDAGSLPKVGVKTLFRQASNIRLAIHFPKFIMKGGEIADKADSTWIDAGGQPLSRAGLTWNGGRQTIHRNHAEVAHFMIKSLDEYLLKIFRGDGLMNSNRHGIDYWRGADHNEVSDLVVADNVSGFTEERDRLFGDPVLQDLHRQAVANRHKKLAGILANPDVQKLRTILKKSTEGQLKPDDIQTSRDLVTRMSPPAIRTDKLLDGDIPHSTLLSITDAGLADAADISWRLFKGARHESTMFWPEKKFGSRPITNLVEGLKRAQKSDRKSALGVRWFHNYARAAATASWPLDDEILVVLTRDDDSLIAGFPAHVAKTEAKHVGKSHQGYPPLRELLTGGETAKEVEALIRKGQILDPRKRLSTFLAENPEAIVLNLDHPEQVDDALARLEKRGPSGPTAARLLRIALELTPPEMPGDGSSDPGRKKRGKTGKAAALEKPAGAAPAGMTSSGKPAEQNTRQRPASETPAGSKKVGILTLPMNRNYGGNLQAYALMHTLRDLGHEPVLLNRRHGSDDDDAADIDTEMPLYSPVVGLGKNVPNRAFVEAKMTPITSAFQSSASLSRQIGRYDFDAIIVGSDQVWRPKYARSILQDFFLGFLKEENSNIKRISYAASFGSDKDEYRKKDKNLVGPLLQKFDAVSVREDSAAALCQDMFGVAAQHVLDPTLLLSRDDYSELLSDHQRNGQGDYLLTYVLDATPDKLEIINRISSALSIPAHTASGLEFTSADALTSKGGDKTVEAWLTSFRNSDYVITDSFHGMAFSIIFNRPFLAYGNPERGLARFQSLLRALGLQDRLVVNSQNVDLAKLLEPIDWPAVNQRLDALREKSIAFLTNALDGTSKPTPPGRNGEQGSAKDNAPTARKSRPARSSDKGGENVVSSDFARTEADRTPFDVHCTGCGACVAESRGTLKMTWTKDGFLEPRSTGGHVPEDVVRVCPFNPAPQAAVRDEDTIALKFLPEADQYDPRIGRFRKTYIGYSKAFRPTSSSGGIATYVFDQLIKRGKVDHLFVVQRTPDGHFAYHMFNDTEDINNTSKTRYYPVTLEELFLKIDKMKGRVGVSGVACFVKAIRLKQHYHPELKDKIPFVSGIICGGLKSRYYTDFLAQSAGISGQYSDSEYRVKSPSKLSSDYSFSATDVESGSHHEIRMQKLGDMWGTGLFKSRACDFCTDVMTELSDISLGDAWLPEYKQDGMGNSVVVTRSEIADKIISDGIQNGELHAKEVSPETAARTQSGGFNHKQKAVKFRLKTEQTYGDRRPPHVRPRMLTDSSAAEIIVQILRNRTRSKSLNIWKNEKTHQNFSRRMRSSLRRLSAATAARKQSSLVEQAVINCLHHPTAPYSVDSEISSLGPILRWIRREVASGRLSRDILDSLS